MREQRTVMIVIFYYVSMLLSLDIVEFWICVIKCCCIFVWQANGIRCVRNPVSSTVNYCQQVHQSETSAHLSVKLNSCGKLSLKLFPGVLLINKWEYLNKTTHQQWHYMYFSMEMSSIPKKSSKTGNKKKECGTAIIYAGSAVFQTFIYKVQRLCWPSVFLLLGSLFNSMQKLSKRICRSYGSKTEMLQNYTVL